MTVNGGLKVEVADSARAQNLSFATPIQHGEASLFSRLDSSRVVDMGDSELNQRTRLNSVSTLFSAGT